MLWREDGHSKPAGGSVRGTGDWVACKVTHTGPLTIGEVNYGIVRPGVIIKVHREQLEEAALYCTPHRPTVGTQVDRGPMGRFVFFPPNRYGYLAGATRVQPWRFYFLPVALAESATFPFQSVPSDSSRVGTKLKDWFTSLGFQRSLVLVQANSADARRCQSEVHRRSS